MESLYVYTTYTPICSTFVCRLWQTALKFGPAANLTLAQWTHASAINYAAVRLGHLDLKGSLTW